MYGPLTVPVNAPAISLKLPCRSSSEGTDVTAEAMPSLVRVPW